MDELQISGKRYISSRRAAQQYGYHSDYIGQLIRSGKVSGQKVGRAWYVDAVSLDTYLGSEEAAGAKPIVETSSPVPVVEAQEEKIEEPTVEEVTKIPEVQEKEAVAEISKKEPEEIIKKEVKEIEKELAVVEEKTEVAEEEHPVLIKRIEEKVTEEKPREVEATSVYATVPIKKRTLTYVRDEAPTIPELTAITRREEEVAATVVESEVRPSRRNRHIRVLGALALVGFLSFGISFAAGVAIVSFSALHEQELVSAVVFSLPEFITP